MNIKSLVIAAACLTATTSSAFAVPSAENDAAPQAPKSEPFGNVILDQSKLAAVDGVSGLYTFVMPTPVGSLTLFFEKIAPLEKPRASTR